MSALRARRESSGLQAWRSNEEGCPFGQPPAIYENQYSSGRCEAPARSSSMLVIVGRIFILPLVDAVADAVAESEGISGVARIPAAIHILVIQENLPVLQQL